MEGEVGVRAKPVVHSREFWAEKVLKQKASGMDTRAFCAAEGVNFHTFSEWRCRLSREKDASGFVEVAVCGSPVSVVLPCGARIEVARGFDAVLLKELVGALS